MAKGWLLIPKLPPSKHLVLETWVPHEGWDEVPYFCHGQTLTQGPPGLPEDSRLLGCYGQPLPALCPLPALTALQNQEHSFKQKVTGPLALVTPFRSQRPSRHRNLFKSQRSQEGLSCSVCAGWGQCLWQC